MKWNLAGSSLGSSSDAHDHGDGGSDTPCRNRLDWIKYIWRIIAVEVRSFGDGSAQA